MPKSLRLTLLHTEDLPTPVAIRLQFPGSSRTRQVSLRKPFEVTIDSQIHLKFYSSGELIGLIYLKLGPETQTEMKWLTVGLAEIEADWGSLPAAVTTGPRVKLAVEAIKPLSPILEANESPIGEREGRDDVETLLRRIEGERNRHCETEKEMRTRIEELQQSLAREKWQNRTEGEQSEIRHKAELSQISIALEKAKTNHKKELALSEALSVRLTENEGKLIEITQKYESVQGVVKTQEDAIRKKSIENAELNVRLSSAESSKMLLESRLKDTESRLFDASNQLSRVKSDLSVDAFTAKTTVKPDISPMNSATSEGKKLAMMSVIEAENAALTLKVSELQKMISRLRSDLAASQNQTDHKDKELRNFALLLETTKAKSQSYETRLKDMQTTVPVQEKSTNSEPSIPDLLDELLKEAMEKRGSSLQFAKMTGGGYQYGKKTVNLSVVRGEVMVATKKKVVTLEEFLREMDAKCVKKSLGATAARRSSAKNSLEIRAKSVDLGRSQLHYRSVSNFIELMPKPGDTSIEISPTQRVNTEQSCSYTHSSDQKGSKLFKPRTSSPRKDYLKGTISSSQKVTEKSRSVVEKQKSRVMKM